MPDTTTSDLAAAWTAAMSQARADLPGAFADDLQDIVAATLQVRFEVAGATYTLQQMLEGNADDEALCEWLQAARPGDYFPDGLGCRCVAHVDPLDTYRRLLASHDWQYERADDQRAWRQGHYERQALLALQQKHDTDWTIWNSVAPAAFRIEDVPL